MFITTLLGMQLAAAQWHWQPWQVLAVFGPLMVIDASLPHRQSDQIHWRARGCR